MKNNRSDEDYIHYLYKITNTLSGEYYIGVHSLLKSKNKEPLSDGYWGSGTIIKLAIKQFGKENFKKEILSIKNTRKEIFLEESNQVSIRTLLDPLNYNVTLGGRSVHSSKLTPVYVNNYTKVLYLDTPTLNTLDSSIYAEVSDEPNYIFIKSTKKISVMPSDRKLSNIKQSFRILRPVLDRRSEEEKDRDLEKSKNVVIVVKKDDPNREVVVMQKDDPRYLSGEYVGVMKGRKMPDYEIQRRKGTGNSGYGTIWITNGVENKKLKKQESIPDGWWKGRVMPQEFSVREQTRYISVFGEKHTEYIYCPKLSKELTIYISFDSIYLDNKLITADYLQEQYTIQNSWIGVSKILKMCYNTLRNIIDFYTLLGYTFSSATSSPRSGSRTKFGTGNSNIAIIHKDKEVALIYRYQLQIYTKTLGWELGLPE